MREPQQGDVIAGKYRIDAPLGRGGMGMVLAATHTFTHRRLAVKWMLPELAQEPGAVERFLREARASARIDHPNVVRVYDVGQHDASLFMVMELLEGEPLSGALARGPLEPPACVALMLHVLRGVGAAHAQGIVHRDIKPDNIFLCRQDGGLGEPKVLDFGISKLTEGVEPGSHTLTGTHTVLGTPYYMSKEQMTRSKGVDHRTDIYALGVVMYQALTGSLPFDGDTYGALAVAIATETPRPIRELRPEISPRLAEVVAKAMAREPEHRYANIDELEAALAACTGAAATTSDLGIAPTVPSVPGAPRLSDTSTPMGTEARERVSAVPGRRRTGVVVLGGAVAVVAAAAALALLPGRDAGAPEPSAAPPVAPSDAPSLVPAEAPHAAAPAPQAAVEPTGEPAPSATPDAGVTDAPQAAKPEPAAKAKPQAAPTRRKPHGVRASRRDEAASPPATTKPAAAPAATPPPPQPATAPTTPRKKARAGDMSLDDFL